MKTELYTNQPSQRLFNTLKKRIKKVLEWKENTQQFFKDLEEKEKTNNSLRKETIEQYKEEK